MPRRTPNTAPAAVPAGSGVATMTRRELARDPADAVRRAHGGSIVITDSHGRARGVLSVPTDRRHVPDIDD
jgi:hypothetical protein